MRLHLGGGRVQSLTKRAGLGTQAPPVVQRLLLLASGAQLGASAGRLFFELVGLHPECVKLARHARDAVEPLALDSDGVFDAFICAHNGA